MQAAAFSRENSPTASDRRRGLAAVAWLATAIGVLGMAAVLRYEPPAAVLLPGFARPLPEICMMRRVLAIPCPGCGLTRCFILAAEGNFAAAAAMHPVGLVLFTALTAQVPLRCHQLLRFLGGRSVYPTWRWDLGLLAGTLLGLWGWWGAKLILL